jgi:hypothetical protein
MGYSHASSIKTFENKIAGHERRKELLKTKFDADVAAQDEQITMWKEFIERVQSKAPKLDLQGGSDGTGDTGDTGSAGGDDAAGDAGAANAGEQEEKPQESDEPAEETGAKKKRKR